MRIEGLFIAKLKLKKLSKIIENGGEGGGTTKNR
jgi:hypothetical protein